MGGNWRDRLLQARIHRSLCRLQKLEARLRNELAVLAELSEPGDDLHAEVQRMLEWLDR